MIMGLKTFFYQNLWNMNDNIEGFKGLNLKQMIFWLVKERCLLTTAQLGFYDQ